MALMVECPACKGAKCDQCNHQGWIVKHDLVLRDVKILPQVTHHCPGCERLRAELLACCELHERSMMIIEEALGPDRPNGRTWRAQQIANEIIALRNFIAMDKEATTGERIRQMRLARGMTQDQLSSAAGISKGFLSDVENGKRDISSRNLLRIATALSASVDYLLQGVFCPDCEAAARERDALNALCDRQADILSRVAVALRGPEPPQTRWSHADLPERAAAVIRERDKYIEAYAEKEVARYDAEQEANHAQRQLADLRARVEAYCFQLRRRITAASVGFGDNQRARDDSALLIIVEGELRALLAEKEAK